MLFILTANIMCVCFLFFLKELILRKISSFAYTLCFFLLVMIVIILSLNVRALLRKIIPVNSSARKLNHNIKKLSLFVAIHMQNVAAEEVHRIVSAQVRSCITISCFNICTGVGF
jgi:hypothetical protein